MRAKLLLLLMMIALTSLKLYAQEKQDTAEFKPSGKLWGYAFGDYFYKGHSDSLNRGKNNQFTGMVKGANAFEFRRIYLGYNYEIAPNFSAELLLAHENEVNATSNGNPVNPASSDLLSDNSRAFYIKLANVRWKNVWKRTDLLIGQAATPAFPLLTEVIWGYRSIERTISDIRRTQSYDFGVSLQGKFTANENYGYDLMIGNGQSAKIENNMYKKFYGDVWAKFLDKKLILDIYSDYEPQIEAPLPGGSMKGHITNNMIKGFIAYTTPKLTVAVEAFVNNLNNEDQGVQTAAPDTKDTLTAFAEGISFYVKGPILKNKLGFFARYDMYNPNTKYDNVKYSAYTDLNGNNNYNSYNKEQFVTAGLDFTPNKQVHIMPNIWYNSYSSMLANQTGSSKSDYDMVYRLTFYYIFR